MAYANGANINVDGMSAQVETANQSYSLTAPDSNTLRYEVRSGDSWTNDVQSGNTSERSEIEMNQHYSPDTQINVSYGFTLEPGAANTASWMVLGQIHNTVLGGQPPFAVGMSGEHMVIMTHGPTGSEQTIYTDPNPIQRGHQYQMNIQVEFGSNGDGTLKVWRDGVEIVNYQGPLGSGTSNESYYWKEGVYRAPSSETVAADYSNLQITTGAASAPTAPTTPTTPTNVAPTVTQVSASPGTGVEHTGDTVTMTVGFSEAVTVTGTPTLSLNDGGKATYVSGSGTNSLTFKTTVASTDTNTSALAITGTNLPNGASIKDAGGLAANLSGAVKTFSGLQISTSSTSSSTTPTDPTTPTSPTTPSATEPVLTVADNSLWVAGRGGHVDLGTHVATTDSNDRVTVNITGLPKYETITDQLDGQTFRGGNITLTAAQVNSGLTLNSYYRGGGQPVATLTLTASATDPSTGAVATAASQTITVTDPRPTSSATTTATSSATTTQTATETDQSHATTTTPDATATASHCSAVFSHIRDLVGGSGVATSASQPIAVSDYLHNAGTTAASQASQSFALLNQYLAGHTGRVDPGQIVSAVSHGTAANQDSLLTKPYH